MLTWLPGALRTWLLAALRSTVLTEPLPVLRPHVLHAWPPSLRTAQRATLGTAGLASLLSASLRSHRLRLPPSLPLPGLLPGLLRRLLRSPRLPALPWYTWRLTGVPSPSLTAQPRCARRVVGLSARTLPALWLARLVVWDWLLLLNGVLRACRGSRVLWTCLLRSWLLTWRLLLARRLLARCLRPGLLPAIRPLRTRLPATHLLAT
ncbi:hypothetical protein JOF29_008104 [Kribbella aluminosa]|uniref:Secreted protein n=1 Tax=Kribbella aluminosa TaxID=416017 RepID=A0ABS4UZN8_9ACTN|nr:hypothetical protein [Kribbella aluminosa]MBP2356994.1 hypothetical protein [Kribbella aluminosa]